MRSSSKGALRASRSQAIVFGLKLTCLALGSCGGVSENRDLAQIGRAVATELD